jgi:hypothetical protein
MKISDLFNEAFEEGKNVQIKEQAGEEIDGRQVWQKLEAKTGELKNKDLTNKSGEKIKYNLKLETIYEQMDKIINKFKMDESEFDPKSNHFFCQLKNLVKAKSDFNIQLNRVMQLGFNAGQLSVFIDRGILPDEITDFIFKFKMLELDTYIDSINQDIINDLYLTQTGGSIKYSKKYFINYM